MKKNNIKNNIKNKQENMNSQDEGKLIKVEVADASGHQTLMLNPQQTEKYVSEQTDMWVFVDNNLLEADNLSNVDWNEAQSVRIMPGLVGGITELNFISTILDLSNKNNESQRVKSKNGDING
jgi:archaellum component FlaG (FlaF/FlaG flagellin family)